MDDNDFGNRGLTAYSDEELLEETALRLQKRFKKKHGSDFRYGSFEFVFHDGRFQSVEERPRSKGYVSHLRLVKP
jgi:hypothetical protein